MSYQFTQEQKEWLTALRSGKFNQTKGCLTRLDGQGNVLSNCCLGVACETFKDRLQVTINDTPGYRRSYNGADVSLPDQIIKLLNLRNEDGDYFNDSEPSGSLVSLNDEAEYTFEQIADFIEKNPELIFKDSNKK